MFVCLFVYLIVFVCVGIVQDGARVILHCEPGAKVMVNGVQVTEAQELRHNDAIMFGANHLWYFVDPKQREAGSLSEAAAPTWEDAQEQIARAQGFAPAERKNWANLTQAEQEALLIQDEIVKVVPLVNEANSISQELDKGITFEVKMINKLVNGKHKPQVGVIVRNPATGASWLWESNKFVNRSFLMRELYTRYVQEGSAGVTKEQDPFWEPSEPVLVGVANVYLAPLSYGVEFDDPVEIRDYKGKTEGIVQVIVKPCDEHGNHLDEEDNFVEDSSELLGKPMYLKFCLPYARGLNPKFAKGIQARWDFYGIKGETKIVEKTTNPEWGFEQVYTFQDVSKKFIDFLESGILRIEVWGEQDNEMKASNAGKPKTALADSGADAIKRMALESQTLGQQITDVRGIVESMLKGKRISEDVHKELMAALADRPVKT